MCRSCINCEITVKLFYNITYNVCLIAWEFSITVAQVYQNNIIIEYYIIILCYLSDFRKNSVV